MTAPLRILKDHEVNFVHSENLKMNSYSLDGFDIIKLIDNENIIDNILNLVKTHPDKFFESKNSNDCFKSSLDGVPNYGRYIIHGESYVKNAKISTLSLL